MSGSLTPLFRYLGVGWQNALVMHFKKKFNQHFMYTVGSFIVSFVVKLANIKHQSSEAYLVKFKENLSGGFKIMGMFFKNHVF